MSQMIRTQIQLTEKQARQLKRWAVEEGVSMAELIRRAVDRSLASRRPAPEERYATAAALVGSFIDPQGATDLSSAHDRHLEDAFR